MDEYSRWIMSMMAPSYGPKSNYEYRTGQRMATRPATGPFAGPKSQADLLAAYMALGLNDGPLNPMAFAGPKSNYEYRTSQRMAMPRR